MPEGLKGNSLDVPTDCCWQDERLDWTGTRRCQSYRVIVEIETDEMEVIFEQ